MNIFCEKDCTGGDYKEIKRCADRWCPFYSFRFMDLAWQIIKRRKHESKQGTIKK